MGKEKHKGEKKNRQLEVRKKQAQREEDKEET
jgi:hypothetical protein